MEGSFFVAKKTCGSETIWVFPKIVVPQNGWCIRENHINMDDLGVPLFSETSIYFEDHPMTCTCLITMEIRKTRTGVIFSPFPKQAVSWLVDGGLLSLHTNWDDPPSARQGLPK